MKPILLLAGIVIGLALVPLVITKEYILNLIILVSLYTVLSQSWNILGGYTGQISLGHSTFFGMGALVFRFLWIAGLSPYLALGAGSISSLLLASAIGFPAFKLKGHYFAIGTLALSMIALITVQNVFPGVSFIPPQYLKGYSLFPIYYMALILGTITILLVYGLSRSKLGLALVSVREDEDAAEAIGINIFKYKVISMSLSTLIAGLGGGLFSFYVASYYYYVPFDLGWSFDPVSGRTYLRCRCFCDIERIIRHQSGTDECVDLRHRLHLHGPLLSQGHHRNTQTTSEEKIIGRFREGDLRGKGVRRRNFKVENL